MWGPGSRGGVAIRPPVAETRPVIKMTEAGVTRGVGIFECRLVCYEPLPGGRGQKSSS